MTNGISRAVSSMNRLIELSGQALDYGSFRTEEGTGYVIQEEYPDFFTGTAEIERFAPEEFHRVSETIKEKIYNTLRERTEACNKRMKSAGLVEKHGLFSFDSHKETITCNKQGNKAEFPLDEGLKLVYDAENNADEEVLILSTVNTLFVAVSDAEENGISETPEYEFGYFEGMQAYIKGTCQNPHNWSSFDINVSIYDEIDQSKQDVAIQRGVPAETRSIEQSIRHIRKRMSEEEGPNRVYELLLDIMDYYKKLS